VLLVERKRLLEALLDNARGLQLIKYVEHLDGEGALIIEHARKLELEGIVSKRADAPYRLGKRPEWIKTKCQAWREANRDRFEKMGNRPRNWELPPRVYRASETSVGGSNETRIDCCRFRACRGRHCVRPRPGTQA
jgi:hypothetical protein